jgi:hypothetical protein
MIFRKIAARPVLAAGLNKAAFATIPPRRRLAATWRRDEATGRVKLVWKLIDIQDNGGAA